MNNRNTKEVSHITCLFFGKVKKENSGSNGVLHKKRALQSIKTNGCYHDVMVNVFIIFEVFNSSNRTQNTLQNF